MTTATVFIVDDDPGIRESLPVLMETAGLKAECFASAEAFLDACNQERAGCLLLDVRMPGLSGPQLQVELARRKISLPVIFLTGYADLATGVDAMKQGAMDFLTKPVNGALLLQRVQAALDLDRERRHINGARQALLSRLQKLSSRERDVLALALTGTASREIAERLQITVAGKLVTFQLIGYEIEEEATWCYLEAASFPGTGPVVVHNKLLYDFLPEQTNLVHFYRDGERSSYKLVNPEASASF